MKITEYITVPSKWLDHQLKDHIENHLRAVKTNTMVKGRGYISKLVGVCTIHNGYVRLADASNRFVITYEVDLIQPKEGDKCEGRVIGVYDQGVFVQVDGFQALVVKPCHHNVGDSIRFVIDNVEIKGNQVSCIGHSI